MSTNRLNDIVTHRSEALIVGVSLSLLGQILLIALGPLSRIERTQAGSAGPAGVALLSSDSLYYLSASTADTILPDLPFNRLAYPLILKVGSLLGSAETFGVVVNFLAWVVAGAALYDLGRRYGRGRAAGLFACAAVLVNPLAAQWVRFVLTETLIYSVAILSVWALARQVRQPLSAHSVLLWMAPTVFAVFLRPNGVLLLGSSVTLGLLLHQRRGARLRAGLGALIVAVWALCALFVFAVSSGIGRSDTAVTSVIVNLTYDGVVVEGSPEVIVRTPMPPAENARDHSLNGALGYVAQHPFDIARLALLRVAYETFQLRPHYPPLVNVVMGLGFGTFLILALLGRILTRRTELGVIVLVMTLPQALLIAMTFAVPESRYGWTYLVTLAVWVGVGAERVTISIPRNIGT